MSKSNTVIHMTQNAGKPGLSEQGFVSSFLGGGLFFCFYYGDLIMLTKYSFVVSRVREGVVSQGKRNWHSLKK